MKYQTREHGDPTCSHPKCRRMLDITYLAGATPLNPDGVIQLCDQHHESFCEKLRSPELTDEPEAPVVPVPVQSLRPKTQAEQIMEGMWS